MLLRARPACPRPGPGPACGRAAPRPPRTGGPARDRRPRRRAPPGGPARGPATRRAMAGARRPRAPRPGRRARPQGPPPPPRRTPRRPAPARGRFPRAVCGSGFVPASRASSPACRAAVPGRSRRSRAQAWTPSSRCAVTVSPSRSATGAPAAASASAAPASPAVRQRDASIARERERPGLRAPAKQCASTLPGPPSLLSVTLTLQAAARLQRAGGSQHTYPARRRVCRAARRAGRPHEQGDQGRGRLSRVAHGCRGRDFP